MDHKSQACMYEQHHYVYGGNHFNTLTESQCEHFHMTTRTRIRTPNYVFWDVIVKHISSVIKEIIMCVTRVQQSPSYRNINHKH